MFLFWTKQLPWYRDWTLASTPPPAEGRYSHSSSPLFPPTSFVLPSFVWFYIFFPFGQGLLPILSWCSASTSVSEGVFLMYLWRDMYSAAILLLLKKAFLSLLFILWNSPFSWVYLPLSPLPFVSLPFSAICNASSDSHFAFLHLFFLGMVLIPASCTVSWISVHNSSGTLWDLIPWIYFSMPVYNHKGFDLGHIWMV